MSDEWAELERLAKAADAAVKTHCGSPHRHDYYVARQDAVQALWEAANPSTVLKLIEAARASQVGMSEANEPQKPNITGEK